MLHFPPPQIRVCEEGGGGYEVGKCANGWRKWFFLGGDEGVKWEKSGRVARGSGREKEREKD